jgi:serine/threonine protein kinase
MSWPLQGIIHRDLKTNNIFRCPPDLCKLGDFGIARELAHDKSMAQTSEATFCRWSGVIITFLAPRGNHF